MIDELKGTFECSGLNLRDCNQYRSGAIGGGIAASVAAGMGVFKSHPSLMRCLTTGKVSNLEKNSFDDDLNGRPLYALFVLGAFGPLAHSTPQACMLPTRELAKEFRILSDESFRESKAIGNEMFDRMLAERAKDIVGKVTVTDGELRKGFLAGLEDLERLVRADMKGIFGSNKDWLLQDIKSLKSQYSQKGSYAEMVADYDKFAANYNLAGKAEAIGSNTMSKLRVWELRDLLRDEKIVTLADPKLKSAYQKALTEFERFSATRSYGAKIDYLKGLGYPSDLIEGLISAEQKRRSLSLTGFGTQRAWYDLSAGAMRSKATLTTSELEGLLAKNQLRFFDHPMSYISHMPGLNSGWVQTVSRAGRAAIAKVASAGAGDLVGLARFGKAAAGTAAILGSAGFAVASEAALHMNEVHCADTLPGQFVSIVYDSENNRCAASNERSAQTDAFLFGLTREEQLKEIRETNGTCEMLMGLYRRYAPSQNWQLQCGSDGLATLTGQNIEGAVQKVTFQTRGDSPTNVKWYSGDFGLCADVAVKDGKIGFASIYSYKEQDQTCKTIGTATRMSENMAISGGGKANKFMRQFSQWQNANAYAFASAMSCCRGAQSELCPSAHSRESRRPKPTVQ